MYLKQVFRYNKWLFAFLVAFTVGQLFTNAKRGMVFSPFYHYGMYSEAMPVQPYYQVFEIVVNDSLLKGSDFSPWQWDRIHWPVVYYSQVNKSNQLYTEHTKRLLQSIHLSPNDKHFLSGCNYTTFERWYKDYLQSLTDKQVLTVEVRQRDYSLISGKLVPGNKTLPLQDLCR